jgi:hypothetical protein
LKHLVKNRISKWTEYVIFEYQTKQTQMRKLTMMLLLCIAAFSAKAALFINNSSPCPVVLVFYAHDANNIGLCSYYSTRLEVPAGAALAYNNVTNLNSPGLGWYYMTGGTGAANLVAASSGFDAVQIWSTDPNGPQTIGNPGSCATSTFYNAAAASCPFTASWTPIGGGNVLLDIN